MNKRRMFFITSEILEGTSSILSGLVSYWKLDEVAGTRIDSCGRNNLTATGTVTYAAGVMGEGVDLQGTGYLKSSTANRPIGNAFTFWGWVYPRNNTDRKAIFTSEIVAGGNPKASLFIQPNAYIFSVVDSVTGNSLASAGFSVPNAWYFMAGRYNPDTKKAELRINAGSWNLGSALTNGPAQNSNILKIGNYNGDVTYPDCIIDSVGYSSRYLSNTEIDRLYNGGSGLEYPF